MIDTQNLVWFDRNQSKNIPKDVKLTGIIRSIIKITHKSETIDSAITILFFIN